MRHKYNIPEIFLKREATLKQKQNSCPLNDADLREKSLLLIWVNFNAAAALRRRGAAMCDAAAMREAAVMRDAVISERWEWHQILNPE